MSSYQKLKDAKLGMSFSTATSLLRKNIMFSLVKKLRENVCHRCNEKIDTIDQFSIDHKESWMEAVEPKTSFFDLTNITYSHTKCNYRSTKRNRTTKSKSGFRGVSYDGKHHPSLPWKACLSWDNKEKNLGRFATPLEAAIAYDSAVETLPINKRPTTNKDLNLLPRTQ
jgi:hypothetical protein